MALYDYRTRSVRFALRAFEKQFFLQLLLYRIVVAMCEDINQINLHNDTL